MSIETKVPTIPAVTDANLVAALRQVKYLLDVREGRVGEFLDANVTFRDLVKSGLAVVPSWAGPSNPVAPPGGVFPNGYNPATDFTIPPAPQNVTATGGMAIIQLQWDTPSNRNHSYAEVWRSEDNVLGNAVLLGTTDTRFYTDSIGSGASFYYWVRFISLANVTGPYQGVDGILGETSVDPAYLISLLEGELSSSELEATLRSRIDLIDSPATMPGSVNTRIAEEAAARAQALNAEATARATSIAQEVQARTSAITAESNARAAALVAEAEARAEDFAQEVQDRTAAITAESEARVTALAAEAQARSAEISLETIARANAITAEAQSRSAGLLAEASARQAAIQTEIATRQAADESLATQVTTLSSSLTTQGNTLNAAIQSESSARATAVQAEASARDTLAAQVRGGYSGNDASQVTSGLIYSERTSRVTADQALQTQITALVAAGSGDFQDLYAAITDEQTARIAGDTASAANVSTLTARLDNLRDNSGNPTSKSIEATIADNRTAQVDSAAALAADFTALSSAFTGTAATLNAALASESSARTTALSAEASQRETLSSQLRGNYSGNDLTQVTSGLIFSERSSRLAAEQSLQSQINLLSAASSGNIGDLLASVQEEQQARIDGDAAEALSRDTLATQLRGNYTGTNSALLTAGLIHSERVSRITAESSFTSSLSNLTATVNNNFNSLSASIASESTARSTAVSSEASQREVLSSRLLGGYTGNDINQLASGLLYQERISRVQADTALTQQIALISASVGDQFDHTDIWYFDSSVEGWSGNGAPTVSGSWLRISNHPSDPYIVSPTGLAVNANSYSQVRLRVRKFGNPTWLGQLWWRATTDASFVPSRRITLSEPIYDANGIGLVSGTPGWLSTIDVIRINLSTAQTSTAYFEIDWVAIGRPSPGASSSSLAEEATARATADAAEITAREALRSQLVGSYAGTDLAQITSGLLFQERQSRATADTAITTQVTALGATVASNLSTTNSAIATEQSTRATADTALTNSINALTATVATNKTAATAAVAAESTARATAISAEATARNTLAAQLTGNYTGTNPALLTSGIIFTERQSRITADSALTTSISQLNATVTGNNTAQSAAVTTEATARANADTALSNSISTLSSTVTNNFNTLNAAIQTESSTRVAADASLATQISTLSSTVTNNRNTLNAAIQTESSTRVSALSSLATQITSLQSTVNANNTTLTAAVQTEATTRANIDTGLLAQYTLKTQVNGYISGFGLANTSNNSAATSVFSILADSFRIASPTGPGITPASPFIVRTTATTIGGQTVPVGVYIKDAFIENGSINNVKIANAAIDNAKIANLDAAKITTGFISADRLDAAVITAKVLTVAAAKVTGLLTANQISGAGLVITSGQYTGYSWPASGGGFYLGPFGLLMGRYSASNPSSGYFQVEAATGNIYAPGFNIVNGNATFAGNLSVVSPTGTARMEITNNVIRVFDANGAIRVRIGFIG